MGNFKMRIPYFALVTAKTPGFIESFREADTKARSVHCDPNIERDTTTGGPFPSEFIWCAATASYQIEGAFDEDNRGSSIWDDFSHYRGPLLEPEYDDECDFAVDSECTNGEGNCFCMTAECHNGDDACKSYN